LRHGDTLPKVGINNIMKISTGLISTIDNWEFISTVQLSAQVFQHSTITLIQRSFSIYNVSGCAWTTNLSVNCRTRKTNCATETRYLKLQSATLWRHIKV